MAAYQHHETRNSNGHGCSQHVKNNRTSGGTTSGRSQGTHLRMRNDDRRMPFAGNGKFSNWNIFYPRTVSEELVRLVFIWIRSCRLRNFSCKQNTVEQLIGTRKRAVKRGKCWTLLPRTARLRGSHSPEKSTHRREQHCSPHHRERASHTFGCSWALPQLYVAIGRAPRCSHKMDRLSRRAGEALACQWVGHVSLTGWAKPETSPVTTYEAIRRRVGRTRQSSRRKSPFPAHRAQRANRQYLNIARQ